MARKGAIKWSFHSVFAAPEYMCDITKGGNLQIKIRVIHVIRVTFSEHQRKNMVYGNCYTVILLYFNAWMIFCLSQTVNCQL